ncbi:MAG: hypothetical protein JW885_11925 [Deltaproteobacteria bacterium]|nr:hypothetical protein [Candidatus Zymogenaceae bacterium]
MRFFSWAFIVAAFASLVMGVVVKVLNMWPLAFDLYPRSFMSFATVCLLFAISLTLMHWSNKK